MTKLPALAALPALILVLAGTSSCAAPLQNGGVEVRPGVAERFDAMCRYGTAAQKVCVAPEEEDDK
jgi:hypothetical protein